MRLVGVGLLIAACFVAGGIAFRARSASGVIKPITAYEADVNKDGVVNPGDQAIVANKVGKPVPTMTPTPTSYCNLSGRNLSNMTNAGVPLPPYDDCQFIGSYMAFMYVPNNSFQRSDFTGANLKSSRLSGANFTDANFSGAVLTREDAQHTRFIRANLTNAILSPRFPAAGCCEGEDFTGANFTGAITTGADITNMTWHNVTCPDGTNSDNDGGSCIGHGFAGTPLPTWTPSATGTSTPTRTPTFTPTATSTPCVTGCATTNFELDIDCDLNAPGTQTACSVPAGTASLDVGVVLKNNTSGMIGVQGFGFTVLNTNRLLLAPTVPSSCISPAYDCNPDFNQAGMPVGGMDCSQPQPDSNQDGDPLTAESLIWCGSGLELSPFLAGGATALLATVHYSVAGTGTSILRPRMATVYDGNFQELSSCAPVMLVAGNCFPASVVVGP